MLDLFQQLQAARQQRPPAKVAFRLNQAEVNDYLRYSLAAIPRPGVRSSTVKFFHGTYVSTFTTVDFDAVERWKPGTIPMLLRPVLKGTKTIWVDVRFQTNNGTATFGVEKAYFQSIRLPTFVVEKVIGIVAARQPEKYDTSKPLPLPFGLKRLWVEDKAFSGTN
jgi:hypothetical protein